MPEKKIIVTTETSATATPQSNSNHSKRGKSFFGTSKNPPQLNLMTLIADNTTKVSKERRQEAKTLPIPDEKIEEILKILEPRLSPMYLKVFVLGFGLGCERHKDKEIEDELLKEGLVVRIDNHFKKDALTTLLKAHGVVEELFKLVPEQQVSKKTSKEANTDLQENTIKEKDRIIMSLLAQNEASQDKIRRLMSDLDQCQKKLRVFTNSDVDNLSPEFEKLKEELKKERETNQKQSKELAELRSIIQSQNDKTENFKIKFKDFVDKMVVKLSDCDKEYEESIDDAKARREKEQDAIYTAFLDGVYNLVEPTPSEVDVPSIDSEDQQTPKA